MKYYNLILCSLVCLFIVFSSCESQSQEDTLNSIEQIAHSNEYHAYQSARHDALVFSSSHDIDYDAILARMAEYPSLHNAEDFAPDLFADIPFAKERHKLQVRRSLAMKMLMKKFEYLSFSKKDRLSMLDVYSDLHKTYYTNEEVDAMLLHNFEPRKY